MNSSHRAKIWEYAPSCWDKAHSLAQAMGAPPYLAHALINRGVEDKAAAEKFLSPSLADLVPPFSMKDMDKATRRILDANQQKEKIIVYGDYDVDGVTSTALLFNYLRRTGANVGWYIPNRLREGYGLNDQAVRALAANGAGLIICVDCGVSNTREIHTAQKLGVDVIIVDHHLPPTILPPAVAILNPRQVDCEFPAKDLCGVGITFLLVAALRAKMRESGLLGNGAAPNLKDELDLVALGTIADLAPLNGQNRILTKFGLETLNKGAKIGLRAIQKVSGLDDKELTSWNVAFQIGPRLNASGRMGDSALSLRLLLSEDSVEAAAIARKLDNYNEERQRIENRIVEEAIQIIEGSQFNEDTRSIVVASERWHRGIVGIVASRLVEKFNRPAVVLAIEDNLAQGSGRSISGFDLYAALNASAEHLVSFGGHRYAAGLKVAPENIELFYKHFEGVARQHLEEENLKPRLKIDAEIELEKVTLQDVEGLLSMEPFGIGNSEPVWASRQVDVLDSRVVGQKHLRLTFRLDSDKTVSAIGFGMAGLEKELGPFMDIAYTLYLDTWRGARKIGIKLKDIKNSG